VMTNQLLLPKSSWSALTDLLLKLRTHKEYVASEVDLAFLRQLGYVDEANALTKAGINLCELIHVRHDTEKADQIVHADMQNLPVTQLLLQSLSGLKDITVDQARMCLLFAGVDEAEVDSCLTSFLTLLNTTNIVTYSRKNRSIRLLVSPRQSSAPAHIYVDKSRPYSNDLWIREIIRECQGSVMWLEQSPTIHDSGKNWQPRALHLSGVFLREASLMIFMIVGYSMKPVFAITCRA
jgi:hypothetical protein